MTFRNIKRANAEIQHLRGVLSRLRDLYRQRLIDEGAARCDLRDALLELVALKAIKDSQGKTAEYERRQPTAWERARAALVSPPYGGKD